jgi:predicted nucleic acid-binding protein
MEGEGMRSERIYLDVCALSRPFDDQSFVRVRLETEAVNLILSHVVRDTLKLVFSPVHEKEIEAISDPVERVELKVLLRLHGHPISVDLKTVRARAEELVSLGFGIADAAHVAFAEGDGASFVSCDEKLIKKCLRNEIAIWSGDPVRFCVEEGLK